jgi:hypothetical protein
MSVSLDTLRRQAAQPPPSVFLRAHPGCWIQYYDDTGADRPGTALSAPAFDPLLTERKQRDRCAVCFSLQAFQGSRTKAGLLSFRNLGVDVDLVPAAEQPGLAAAEVDRRKDEYLDRRLKPFPLRPHWLVETRHGFHIIFRVMPVRGATAVGEAEGLNRRLVRALHGDENAALLTQVLRVPGTYHFKDPEHPFLCRLLVDRAAAVPPYPLDRVRAVLKAWEKAAGSRLPDAGDRRQGRSWTPLLCGVPEGQRNASAAAVAGAVLCRLPPDLWEFAGWGGLKEWNGRNAVPLPEGELRSVFDSILRRERATRDSAGPSASREHSHSRVPVSTPARPNPSALPPATAGPQGTPRLDDRVGSDPVWSVGQPPRARRDRAPGSDWPRGDRLPGRESPAVARRDS